MKIHECVVSELLTILQITNEEELKQAINYEASAYCRPYRLTRMHQRYCRLRDAREREELLAGKTLL